MPACKHIERMPYVKKYRYLPIILRIGILVTALVVGFSGCDKNGADPSVDMETQDTFSIAPVIKEIHVLDSLWEAGNVTLMEAGFQQLLEREHEWAGKLDAGEYA